MNQDFLEKIKHDFKDFRFLEGRKFAFRPPKTIILGPPEPYSELLALHEVSHAILGHKDFKTDVSRLRMESEAWEKAKELAFKYKIEAEEDVIQEQLDTYRDWLHKKSRCPKCGLTRFQSADGIYHCPRCEKLLNQIS